VTGTLQRIEKVLEGAAAAARLTLALQGRADALRGEIAQLSAMVRTTQAGRRQALLEPAEPLLFSGEHRAQLREGGWRAWDPTEGIQSEAYLAFARGNLGLLGFHVLLALLIGGVMRTLSRTTLRKGAGDWSGLPEHPWALGVFVSVVVAMTRITLAPPLWDVLLWSLFGASAAILGRRLIDVRSVRLTVYLLAAFYPAFLLLEVFRLPEPVFRVGLAAVAACAIPLFLLLARAEGAGLAPGYRLPAGESRADLAPPSRSEHLDRGPFGAGVGLRRAGSLRVARHRDERGRRLHGHARLRPRGGAPTSRSPGWGRRVRSCAARGCCSRGD
jgi:hypothetical protein